MSSLKLTNPLYYPITVFVSGAVLITGVRLFQLPNTVMIPTAVGVALVGAAIQKSREPDTNKLAKQQLQRELQAIQSAGKALAEKAEVLRQESSQLLTHSSVQVELLVAVQEACDRAIELPIKIEQFTAQLQSSNSLLSVNELQQQLLEVQSKQRSSSGVARQQLQKLEDSLKRNIQLAQEGQDTQVAQLVSLYTLIQNSAGVLQQLQNKLRTADLSNSEHMQELQSLSAELNSVQENVEFLIVQ